MEIPINAANPSNPQPPTIKLPTPPVPPPQLNPAEIPPVEDVELDKMVEEAIAAEQASTASGASSGPDADQDADIEPTPAPPVTSPQPPVDNPPAAKINEVAKLQEQLKDLENRFGKMMKEAASSKELTALTTQFNGLQGKSDETAGLVRKLSSDTTTRDQAVEQIRNQLDGLKKELAKTASSTATLSVNTSNGFENIKKSLDLLQQSIANLGAQPAPTAPQAAPVQPPKGSGLSSTLGTLALVIVFILGLIGVLALAFFVLRGQSVSGAEALRAATETQLRSTTRELNAEIQKNVALEWAPKPPVMPTSQIVQIVVTNTVFNTVIITNVLPTPATPPVPIQVAPPESPKTSMAPPQQHGYSYRQPNRQCEVIQLPSPTVVIVQPAYGYRQHGTVPRVYMEQPIIRQAPRSPNDGIADYYGYQPSWWQ